MVKRIELIAIAVIILTIFSLIALAPQEGQTNSTGLFNLSFSGEKVTRNLATKITPDTNLTITINVELDENTSIYGVDETFPEEFTLVDARTGTSDGNNSIRWFDFEATPSTTATLTYIIKSPSTEGTYNFSGEYLFENDENVSLIGGSTSLEVKIDNPITLPPNNGMSGNTGGNINTPTENNDTNSNDTNNPITPPIDPTAKCGDLKCNGNENCESCFIDCGVCNTLPNIEYDKTSNITINIEEIGELGRNPFNYAYILIGLGLIATMYAIFRLLRIKKGKPPSTIDWKKINIGIKNI